MTRKNYVDKIVIFRVIYLDFVIQAEYLCMSRTKRMFQKVIGSRNEFVKFVAIFMKFSIRRNGMIETIKLSDNEWIITCLLFFFYILLRRSLKSLIDDYELFSNFLLPPPPLSSLNNYFVLYKKEKTKQNKEEEKNISIKITIFYLLQIMKI